MFDTDYYQTFHGQTGVVCGVDITRGMLAVTRKRLRGSRAALALGDAAALPLASERFDLVFMSFVLELVPTGEIPVVLSEVMRVLRRGGRFVDVSLSRESPNLATQVYEWGHRVFPGLVDCRPIYVRRAVAVSGFEIVNTRRITIFGLPVEMVLARKPHSGGA